jgi:hypothetical protein
MSLMKNIFKKIIPVIFVALLLLVVGVFFGGLNASASSMSGATMNCDNDSPVMLDVQCAMDHNAIQENGSASKTFMPCCLERHDNSETTMPSAFQDRIKFSEFSIANEVSTELLATQQRTYLSSKSPPEKADILSSVVKIE